ncbi:trypco2 family protein [Streptomyces hirsutus]|uniref:trypco2 family protein n=1 Tax=Streptomyces hirsutus TaxID=35620 RepID=UPI0006E1FA00|nr:trypco2 family protein [Streptomyces hirsutus]
MRDMEPIGLAEAIGSVRAELARAQAEGAESDWRFNVEQVSLEFSVQFHRAGEGGAGLRLGVVEARLGGSVSHDSTHRIEVTLKPLPRPDGTHHEVSREDAAAHHRPGPHDDSLSLG